IGARGHQRLPAASFAREHLGKFSPQVIMFDFIKRSRLVKRGLASGKTRRRINKNELLHTLESAASVKWVIFAAFIGGLAVLIFSGQQPEPTKNFVISLLFFATAVTQLWINQPTTFVRSSRIIFVFVVIFVQLASK